MFYKVCANLCDLLTGYTKKFCLYIIMDIQFEAFLPESAKYIVVSVQIDEFTTYKSHFRK